MHATFSSRQLAICPNSPRLCDLDNRQFVNLGSERILRTQAIHRETAVTWQNSEFFSELRKKTA